MLKSLLSIPFATIVALSFVKSVPVIQNELRNDTDSNDSTTSGPVISIRDYVREDELDNILARVRNESLTFDSANYVSDEIPFEEILRLIEANEPTTISPAPSVAESTTEPFDGNSTTIEGFVIGSSQRPNLNGAPVTQIAISNGSTGLIDRNASETTTPPNSMKPTDPTQTIKATTLVTTEEPEECPICYLPLHNESISITTCGHKFHRRCLNEWSRRKQVSSMHP